MEFQVTTQNISLFGCDAVRVTIHGPEDRKAHAEVMLSWAPRNIRADDETEAGFDYALRYECGTIRTEERCLYGDFPVL